MVSWLRADLGVKQAAPRAIEMELHRMKREARRRIDDMQTIMERNPDEARSLLEGLLGGPILCGADQSARMCHMRAPLRIREALGLSVSIENVPSGI